MQRRELVDTLSDLHGQLSGTAEVDSETLELLRKLTTDIDRLLDKKRAVTAEEAEPVTSGIKNLLLKFEADHPQLSAAVGKVADALAAVGF